MDAFGWQLASKTAFLELKWFGKIDDQQDCIWSIRSIDGARSDSQVLGNKFNFSKVRRLNYKFSKTWDWTIVYYYEVSRPILKTLKVSASKLKLWIKRDQSRAKTWRKDQGRTTNVESETNLNDSGRGKMNFAIQGL